MVKYRRVEGGRVVTRSEPDPGLEASKRWERVEPLSLTPLPDRAPDEPEAEEAPENESEGDEPEHDDDGDEPSGEE